MRQAGPYFLSIDDETITLEHRPRLQAGEIGTSIGLGITLTPDFFSSQHFMQVAIFLFRRAHEHQGRSDSVDRKLIGAVERQSEAQHFILIDRLLHQRGTATAMFFWPVEGDITGI